mmetsp:Transcript_74931/g.138090  ORF Transcript_74931/g.138090 Transcript_74931/m.138090 type:complete len:95 (+) Transcript_74931:82-366(+)
MAVDARSIQGSASRAGPSLPAAAAARGELTMSLAAREETLSSSQGFVAWVAAARWRSQKAANSLTRAAEAALAERSTARHVKQGDLSKTVAKLL